MRVATDRFSITSTRPPTREYAEAGEPTTGGAKSSLAANQGLTTTGFGEATSTKCDVESELEGRKTACLENSLSVSGKSIFSARRTVITATAVAQLHCCRQSETFSFRGTRRTASKTFR